MKRALFFALFLLALLTTAQAQPSTITVTGTLYKSTGAVCASCRLTISKTRTSGQTTGTAAQEIVANASGVISFTAIQNSFATITGPFVRGRYNFTNGIELYFPAQGSASFDDLKSAEDALLGVIGSGGGGSYVPAINTLTESVSPSLSDYAVIYSVADSAHRKVLLSNLPGGGGGGSVNSVFGRTGNVVAATNDYTWAQINKTTSSLADITTRSAGDLSSGTLPDGRFPATLPAVSGANLTSLNASNLASGIVPLARISGITTSQLSATAGITSAQLASAIDATKLADGSVSNIEFQYLDGVTSAIQTQLNAKAASTHAHAQSDITNLTTDLAAKAPLASPGFTGVPTAPTAANGTNTAQIATTAFVQSAIVGGTAGVASFNGRTGIVVPATNDYTWAQIDKTTSSLADLTTRSASDLSSGTLPLARLSGITSSQLSGTAGITNGQLANSSISIAGTSTALGGSISLDTITGLAATGIVRRTGANALGIAAAGTDFVAPGAATGSGLTMTTARILGRTTASTGAIEEITIGSGLSLSAGTLSATGGGSGTVTSFSASNLSPLFTTSVSNATSTPALSFTLSNATANTYFGNATGLSGAPSFTAAGALTKTDDTNVTLTLGGSPSTALLNAASITAGWTGTLAKGRQNVATVYNDAGNTFSTGAQSFAAASSLVIPTGAGAAPTANATIAYDSTANAYKFGVNGSSKTVLMTDGSGANLTNLNASNLASGTVPDARFPATLPALSGANLTALNASNLGSGTVPDARFPATLPALSGVNLTSLNASNLASGTVADARLSSNVFYVDGARSGASSATTGNAFRFDATSLTSGSLLRGTIPNASFTGRIIDVRDNTGTPVDKFVVDATGAIVAGSIAYSSVTGRPTTLSGYGITDAQPLDSDLTAIAAVSTTSFGRGLLTETNAASLKTTLSLGNVENTALSTWAGSTNLTTLGTIATGTWQGSAIADSYISSATTWNAKVGPTRTITAGTGLSGGGDLSADRTLSLDINGLTAETGISAGDFVSIYDVSAGALRKMTRSDFVAGLTGGGGGGLSSLNGLTANPQSFAKTDDTNVTLSITSAVDTHTFALGWTGSLAKGRQNAATVYNDAANTFSTGAQSFAAASSLVIPTGAGAAPTANAAIAYDSTANAYKFGVNGSSKTVLMTDGSGANLTSLNASNLASGTVPDARFPATLPALSGANLTALNASNLGSGTVPLARLSGITNTEISGTAAIAYSKLSLTGTIVNADISASAAIANSKLANSSITIAGTSTALGGSISLDTITGLASTGIIKRTAANTLAAAVSGTDYAPATSGSSILYGNGAGGFSNVTVGSGLSFSGGTLSAVGGGGDALTTNPLSQFAATTSLQLAGVITNETGSGALVFGTSPILTNSTINQAANNADALTSIRFTDTSPTGNFLRFRNAANAADLFAVDVTGTVTAGTVPSARLSGALPALDGSALTALNASNLGSGTVPLARLSGITNTEIAAGAAIALSKLASGSSIPTSITNDTNVTGSISANILTLGWTGTLAAGRLNSNVVQAITNDTNITGSISAQTLTLGFTGTLAKGRQNAATVYNDAANTFSTGAQSFAAASSLVIPTGAGAAPTANATIAYDSTANAYKFGVNGASKTVLMTDGDGGSLTNLNASNLASGTVPLARISGITSSQLSGTAGITNAQLAGSIAISKLSITGTPDGTKFLRDDGSWQTIGGGGDALTTNPLSQFASTTSAQLAGVLSDETGSGGGFVRATAPTIAGGSITGLTAFGIRSSGTGAFDLTLANSENLTAGRTLTIATGDASRTLTMAGNATISGTNTGDQTITLTGDVTGSGTSSFSTTIANSAVTNDKLANSSLTVTAGTGLSGGGSVSLGASTSLSLNLAGLTANQTLWDSANASRTLTAGLSGANDPVITFSDGTINVSTGALQVGGTSVSLAGHAHAASDITSGQIVPARGGTGIDTSGSTGVLRVSSGTWSANAGVQHLASSTSADLAGVLSDETGSGGGFVRATSPTIAGGSITGLTALGIRSSGTGAFDLTLANSENLTAGRTLTIATGDASRTLTLGGNATLNGGTHSGTNTGDQTITLTGDVTGSGTGSFAATIANSAVTNAKLANSSVTIGSTSVSLGSTAATIAGLTLTTPTIASFANATHNHTNAAGGGQLSLSAFSATTGSGNTVGATSPTLTNSTINQAANNADALTSIRFTDTSPTGNFLRFRNAANAADLFAVDVTGTVTAGTVPSARLSGALPALDGSALTALNASNLGSGTVPLARLSGITNTEIAAGAAIANSKLANSSISIAGTSTALGGSISLDTITGLASTGIVRRTGANALGIAAAGTDFVAPGAATGSGLTMTTARILGRTTASTGAIEEITIGSGLSLSAGTLSATGGGGSPGGTDTQLQRNNAGAFGGISGVTSDGTNITAGSGNLRATLPRITTGLGDSNGNQVVSLTATSSAVNSLTIANSAAGTLDGSFRLTGNFVTIGTTGSDAAVKLKFAPKGSTYPNGSAIIVPFGSRYDDGGIQWEGLNGYGIHQNSGGGWLSINANNIALGAGGAQGGAAARVAMLANTTLNWTDSVGTPIDDANDSTHVLMGRRAADNLRFGPVDADTNAAVRAQTLSVQGLSSGGTANQAGKDWTFRGSQSKGTGAGGGFVWQVTPAGSTGTALNSYQTALTIAGDRSATFAGAISGTTANFSGAITVASCTGCGSGGLGDPGSNGVVVRTASNTTTARTITGTANLISVTNGDGVSGNPTLTVGSLVVRTDQGNTFSTGAQSFAAASSLVIPTSAGAAPTANATIAYDSTANAYKFGVNGSSKTVLMTDGSGASLTNLNASSLSSGTVPLAQLSGITTTQLSGTASITNGQLANSSVTIGSTSVSLGGTAATIAGLTLTTPNLGTPSGATLTNATGLPISTGVSGLGTGVATFLATPSSANLASAVTGETGSGALVFGALPTLTNGTINQAANNADALTSIRFTDTSPTGSFLRFRNAANNSDLFAVSVAGTITSGTWNGSVIGSSFGGAGTVTGLLKANGSGAVSAAVSGTDYAPATSGNSILSGNGSGGFSSVTVGSGLSFSGGTLSATGGTPAWSSLTDPSVSLALSMGTNLTTFTWGTGTGTNVNLFTLRDTNGNTGTGYVLSAESVGSSTTKPFRAVSNSGGVEMRNDGILYSTGSGGINAAALVSGTVPLARLSGITNTEIAGGAAIAYSKLNLAGSIVSADLAGSITSSKLVGTDISVLGTVTTGTWNATTIAVNRGGTGQISYTDGQLLIGNSTGNTLTKSTLTAGTNVAITNGAGAITVNAFTATQNANLVFAGPSTGSPAAPTFRSLVAADISNGLLTHAKLTIPASEAEASSSQTISNATLTAISLQTELSDNDNMHSTVTNTSRMTATTAGTYLVTGTIPFIALTANARIIARIYKNGTASGTVVVSIDQEALNGALPSFNLSAVVTLSAGDYVELVVYHTMGSNTSLYNDATLKARMNVVRIGGLDWFGWLFLLLLLPEIRKKFQAEKRRFNRSNGMA